MDSDPALKALHSEEVFSQAKLNELGKLATEELRHSLLPGQPASPSGDVAFPPR